MTYDNQLFNYSTTMQYTPEQYQQQLKYCLSQQETTIASHTLENHEKVWVRRADKHNALWPYYLLGAVTKLLGADALKPVPSLGGNQAIRNESAALKRLAEEHILAPTLLANSVDALMMSHLSDRGSLMDALLQAQQSQDNERLLSLWEQGITAIATVHKKNQHLSQCFARNMMVCPDEQIGFIDFEDEPSAFLTLAQCQTRDWLCYLHSTAFLLDEPRHRQHTSLFFRQVLGTQADTVIQHLSKNTRYLNWLRHLKHQRWGRDTLRIAAFMRFMAILKAE